MIVVPRDTPVTFPTAFTVAIPGLVLVQVPPGVPSLREIVERLHKLVRPLIGAGCVFTVTVVVEVQLPIV